MGNKNDKLLSTPFLNLLRGIKEKDRIKSLKKLKLANWGKAFTIDELTPEHLVTGWVRWGRISPWCRTTYNEADVMTLHCWDYLHMTINQKRNLSIKKFCNHVTKSARKRKRMAFLLRRVVKMLKNPPENLREEWDRLDRRVKEKQEETLKKDLEDSTEFSQSGILELARKYRYVLLIGLDDEEYFKLYKLIRKKEKEDGIQWEYFPLY